MYTYYTIYYNTLCIPTYNVRISEACEECIRA